MEDDLRDFLVSDYPPVAAAVVAAAVAPSAPIDSSRRSTQLDPFVAVVAVVGPGDSIGLVVASSKKNTAFSID